ncbi:hypothetical protein AAHA92_30529 [Salvia divinorum]|uniref:Methyl-CpG-binding domain-containing protein 8 n=1 Tax=Salvia divinorum TaxID=28513 RepID=A0ABD1FR57_SALDI
MASVGAANPPPSHGPAAIRAEDLARIDIGLLSQSELQALSLCSVSAPRRSDDVVSPQLDRSVFNESAGSRRQTYSRLRHRSHSRLPRLHQPHSYPQHSSDPVSHSIVHFLKHFLKGDHNPPPPPAPQDSPKVAAAEVDSLGLQEKVKLKRNRARRGGNLSNPMRLENGAGIELQRVNGKGEMVDFAELGKKGDEMYGDELRRRTAGLETEEAVLGVLRELEGEWCSRRKKRKYVDSGLFGDALPTGWKLLLGLRRRGHRVSVYCRRYISPTGQQFLSCAEAAAFLRSYFSNKDADQQMSACAVGKTDDIPRAVIAHSAPAGVNSSSAHENEDCLMGIENLPEVQVRDVFECVKCKLTFDEKSVYLQHLFSFHQKTTKRYKLGTPVGEGVIIRDGKYECQFCHKVFQERRSYNGHVGSHVRNTGKNSGELGDPVDAPVNAESALLDGALLKSSKMDALIEIARNSTFQTTANHSAVVLRAEEARAASSCHEEKSTSDPVVIRAEDCSADRNLPEDLNHGGQASTKDNGIPNDDEAWNVNVKADPTHMSDSGPVGSCEIQKYENSSLEVNRENRSLKTSEDLQQDAPGLTVEEIFEGGVPSVPLTQSFQFFPPFDSVPNKGEHEFSVDDQKLENVTGFEELGFDDMEPFKYGFGNGQELSSLPGDSINLNSNSGIEDEFDPSVRFGQLTVCVWCREEFRLEGMESETLSDSIGYMCPTCKANISGHFDGALSMDPHNF